jgi:hypothetical protein
VELWPQLVFTDWNEGGKAIDSDIQNISDILDFTLIEQEPEQDLKKHFTFLKGLDQPDNDVYYGGKKDILEMFKIALSRSDILCFNTLGFYKSRAELSEFKPTPYFGAYDGTYIKNAEKYITVRPICNWCDSASLCREWNKLTKGNGTWNALKLTDAPVADYYAIINKPCDPSDKSFDPARTVVFQMEPWCDQEWQRWGVKTWGEWAKPDETKFMEVRSHENTYNNGVWEFELTYPELVELNPEKTKGNVISSICSSKYFDPGHIKRIDLFLLSVVQSTLIQDTLNV